MSNTIGTKIEDMTPEQIEILNNVLIQTYNATKAVLEGIMEALVRANLIDEHGNLTEQAKALLESEQDNAKNTTT